MPLPPDGGATGAVAGFGAMPSMWFLPHSTFLTRKSPIAEITAQDSSKHLVFILEESMF